MQTFQRMDHKVVQTEIVWVELIIILLVLVKEHFYNLKMEKVNSNQKTKNLKLYREIMMDNQCAKVIAKIV